LTVVTRNFPGAESEHSDGVDSTGAMAEVTAWGAGFAKTEPTRAMAATVVFILACVWRSVCEDVLCAINQERQGNEGVD
jgi:hypothetical protein